MTIPVYHAIGGVLTRKGRSSVGAGPVPAGFTRPTGPGYYAIEDLGVALTFAGFKSAMTQVKALATGVDSKGRTHRTLTLPAMTIEAPGFAESTGHHAILLAEGVSITGMGPEQTLFEVAQDSITQSQVDGGYPPMDVYPGTIGLAAMVVPNGTGVQLAQLGLRGTRQRVSGTGVPAAGYDSYHYNGLHVSRCTAPLLQDVKVWGIPGYRNSPPGETFGINIFRGSGARLIRVECDGRNTAGTAVGAAGIGTNTTTNVYLESSSAHHMGFSHGFAFWETNGVKAVDCVATHNGQVGGAALGGVSGDGFNFERSRSTELIRPTVGFNSLCELRYYGRNDGDAFDGDTGPHRVEGLKLLEGALDIWIDSAGTAGSVQTTRPTLVNCPPPAFSIK